MRRAAQVAEELETHNSLPAADSGAQPMEVDAGEGAGAAEGQPSVGGLSPEALLLLRRAVAAAEGEGGPSAQELAGEAQRVVAAA